MQDWKVITLLQNLLHLQIYIDLSVALKGITKYYVRVIERSNLLGKL